MKNITVWWVLLLIVVAAVGIRSYELTARSLWFDEAFSWRLIQFPVAEMIARDAADVHPPFYYVVLKSWSVVFGGSLLALRSFSVALAGLTVAFGYLLAAEAFKSRATGLLAALLLALSGWQIQFAWEARMYTLATALVLLSTWALLKGVRSKRLALGWWTLYVVSTLALMYVHYYALFSVLAQFVFVLGYIAFKTRGRIGEMISSRTSWLASGAGLLLVLGYLPWLPTFFRQNAQVQTKYWIPEIGGWSIPDTFYRMLAPTALIPRHSGLGWILLAALPMAAVLIIWRLLVARRAQRQPYSNEAAWLIVLMGVVPFVLSISLSFLGASLYQDRFFVLAHLFIIIALAGVLARIPWPMIRRVVYVAVSVLFILASFSFWLELDIGSKGGARAAAIEVFEGRDNGEPVLVSSPFVFFAVDYYATHEFTAPGEVKLHNEEGELEHFAGGPILMASDLAPANVFDNQAVVWVVDTTGFGEMPLVLPEGWIAMTKSVYPEVFDHQGEVLVTKYELSGEDE